MTEQTQPNGMPRKLRDAWLAKLRDPDTTQLFESYFHYNKPDSIEVSHDCGCAMGLLYIAAAEIVEHNIAPTYMMRLSIQRDLFGMALDDVEHTDTAYTDGRRLLSSRIIQLNDDDKLTLPQIADWIEQHVPVLDTDA